MKWEKTRRLIEQWSSEPGTAAGECPVCSAIHISTQEKVPHYIALLDKKLSVGPDMLLLCSGCGQFYQYTSWMSEPDWGEAMEGITEPYEVLALYKRSRADVINWLKGIIARSPETVKIIRRENKTVSGKKTKEISYHCPECGSQDVEIEYSYEFTRYTCGSCGYEDVLDDWQRDEREAWRG